VLAVAWAIWRWPAIEVTLAGEKALGPPAIASKTAPFSLAPFVSGLSEPVHLTAPPGDAHRVFICEKTGRVRVVKDGVLLEAPFLDVRARVSGGSEQGLLSLAFHPKYAENGRFFIDITDRKGDTRVIEMCVARDDPDRADAGFEREVLFVKQPYANHNGGLVVFGPDGKLWTGMGDGGAGGDPHDNGQNLGSLLGKMLRLDVDGGDAPYSIPNDNPFVGREGARGEIWAYGLRNPWRFCFDRETGDLYIADVGQDKWEEVDVVAASSKGGENYGWNIMEGLHDFRPRGRSRDGLTAPVVEMGHDAGVCIIGGFVYRGAAVPALRGWYVYADYGTGVFRGFRWKDGKAQDHMDWTEAVNPRNRARWTSFGEDAAGEMYVLSQDGEVLRLAPVRAGF
jgi:glucose/arabinose dehydrogenase